MCEKVDGKVKTVKFQLIFTTSNFYIATIAATPFRALDETVADFTIGTFITLQKQPRLSE